jgi:hypothetical protein
VLVSSQPHIMDIGPREQLDPPDRVDFIQIRLEQQLAHHGLVVTRPADQDV